MAELEPPTSTPETPVPGGAPPGGSRSKDEVALDLMKFIAIATGYGKASQSSAGFSTKPMTRSAEEHAEALLELFERCRRAVNQAD
ncbi:MAG: hypothetical protein LAQ69_24760 [Acidobacteriia bacterium]|jgi:hypothetical protein|nr:hypothetical protein [Terriglobia bacterium]